MASRREKEIHAISKKTDRLALLLCLESSIRFKYPNIAESEFDYIKDQREPKSMN